MSDRLAEIDCEMLFAKGEPRPLFVVIRPNVPLSPQAVQNIRDGWEQFVAANPTADIPPCVVVPHGLDIEAVYPPRGQA